MTIQRTLVLLKPDTVQRGLVGELISRIERRGLKPIAAKMMAVDGELARRHYGDHVGKPFFPGLIEFITSGPIVALAVEGENAIEVVRTLMGATDPLQASPGTVRGDYALSIGPNLIHGSDSEAAAGREIRLFFEPDELLSYERDIDRWITEP